MIKNNVIRFVHSLILLPVVTTMSVTAGSIPKTDIPQNALFQKQNIEISSLFALNPEEDENLKLLQKQGEMIDAYFKARNAPLYGTGFKMALEAEKNDLDWRLLAAISIRESNGGIEACKKVTHSFFGWGSCKINFESDEKAIEIVAHHLGGNHPKTEKYYKDKSTYQILRKYNTVISKYPEQVIKIMDAIGPEEVVLDTQKEA